MPTGLWAPCIVGKYSHNLTITATVSLVTRSIFLAIACILASTSSLPQYLATKPTLLTCTAPETVAKWLNMTITNTSTDGSCLTHDTEYRTIHFDKCTNNNTNLYNRYRICEGEDNKVKEAIVIAFVSLIILNIVSIFILTKLKSYKKNFTD